VAKFKKEKTLKHAESMYVPRHTVDMGLDYFAQQSLLLQRPGEVVDGNLSAQNDNPDLLELPTVDREQSFGADSLQIKEESSSEVQDS
jgi:hypothetical protein